MASQRHLDALINRYPQLSGVRSKINDAFSLLKHCYRNSGKLIMCGNGGSASDCEHIAGELMKGFLLHRPLPSADQEKLIRMGEEGKALANKLQCALPVIVLTGLPSLSSAFGNDVDPQMTFAQQAFAYANKGDVFLGITTSGNAVNVRLAAMAAKCRGAKTIGLTGSGGGRLAAYCDVVLDVPETETFLVQELHLPVYHCLCAMLEEEFFGEVQS